MDSTRFNEKDITLFDRNVIEELFDCAFLNSLSDLFSAYVLIEALDKRCTRFCINDIPHFGLSKASVLVDPCIFIIRVHLD